MKGNTLGGYFVAASDIEKLQRIMGEVPSKRATFPDPMTGHHLDRTHGCPCDKCIQRDTCQDFCRVFTLWVAHGCPKRRTRR